MIIHSKFRPLLSHGITVECTFHHNDKTRKSYNFVEVVYSARDHGEGYIAKTVTKTFKPQSAEMTFQSMLQNKHFFIQGWRLKSLTSEATPSATQFFKLSYKISHPPGL